MIPMPATRTVAAVHVESPLPHLVRDGILVRTAGRLRVSSRFLAHAERAAAQDALHGTSPSLASSLEHALRMHGYGGDGATAAHYLSDFMAERGQLGALQPVFGTMRLGVLA